MTDPITEAAAMLAAHPDPMVRLIAERLAGTLHNSVRLLCLLLHRHKAHPRPLRRFADRLSIRHIILLPLDEGLHVSRWDQPHRVAQLTKLPRPVVRPATSLQRHKTAWLPREKLEHLGPHQALAEHHPAGRIGSVRLKYPLRNIKPYRASLAHGRLPCGGHSTPPPWHIDAVGGRPHHHGRVDRVMPLVWIRRIVVAHMTS